MDVDLQPLTDAITADEGLAPLVADRFKEFGKELSRLGALPTVDPAAVAALGARATAIGVGMQAVLDANPDPNPND